MNLVVNARDAVSPGARIVVETSNEAVDAGIASHIGIREGDYVVVSVTDDGTGMAPDVIARHSIRFLQQRRWGVDPASVLAKYMASSNHRPDMCE